MSIALVVALLGPVVAASPPSQREVNGFLLGQYNSAATHRFGKPFLVQTTSDGWVQRGYKVDETLGAYMVVESVPAAASTMYAIQISGKPGTKMLPFYGVRIGDAREAVFKRFGEPSETKPLSDVGGELALYKGRNYSFEFDEAGRLSSVRIVGYEGFATEPHGDPDLNRFVQVAAQRDLDGTLGFLMPDVEITTAAGDIRKFTLPARQELSDPKSPIHRALFGEAGVARALTRAPRPETGLRVREDGVSYPIMKFSTGRVSEIVWRFHAARWRVWEVRLRS